MARDHSKKKKKMARDRVVLQEEPELTRLGLVIEENLGTNTDGCFFFLSTLSFTSGGVVYWKFRIQRFLPRVWSSVLRNGVFCHGKD